MVDLGAISKKAIILCAVRDPKQVIRFPGDGNPLGGLELMLDHSLLSHQQIVDRIVQETSVSREKVALIEAVEPVISYGAEKAKIVLALVHPSDLIAPESWDPLPQIIVKLPKDKTRVPYIKVMQILAGGYDSSALAVELSQELLTQLKAFTEEDQSTSD